MRIMKPLAFLTAKILLLSGCVGVPIVPPKEVLDSIQRIYLVAMEPLPLEVPAQLAVLPLPLTGLTQGPLVVAGLLMLVQIPQAARVASAPAGRESALRSQILSGEGVWVPTTVLAEEMERQLASAGRSVERSPKIQSIPGVTERSYTVFGENWLAPIRAWYNAEQSSYDYSAHQVSQHDTILEIGISNYSVYLEDRLLLQVHCRLVDPTTGKTLGRARASADPRMQMETAFADGGKVFKKVFRDTGGKLTGQCLEELRLLPHS